MDGRKIISHETMMVSLNDGAIWTIYYQRKEARNERKIQVRGLGVFPEPGSG